MDCGHVGPFDFGLTTQTAQYSTDNPLCVQSISPGVVETEFAPRLYSDNPEIGAALYTKYKVTM